MSVYEMINPWFKTKMPGKILTRHMLHSDLSEAKSYIKQKKFSHIQTPSL
ncbi:MAG: hypothetical protein KJ799_11725 [Bacteroidetes bacterium]|nr:hypothetical protein [Bacteroidota bacterium]MBU1678793.1 hypothetical protein [Bacteroidota bacterium]MBU2507374.1 hypothetical protein [Bacteroidota bacterium]